MIKDVMLRPEYTNQFRKDTKLMQKRGANMELLKDIINKLCDEQPLEIKNREHLLKGNWIGFTECHIQSDWLLIYQIGNGIIVFERTGTHSDLF